MAWFEYIIAIGGLGVAYCLMLLAQFISSNLFHLQDFRFASGTNRSQRSLSVSTVYDGIDFSQCYLVMSSCNENLGLELGVYSNVFIFRGNDMGFENGRCWWTFVFKTAPLRFLRRLSPSKLYFQSSFKCHTKAPLRFHWSSCQDLCSWRLWGPTYSWSIFVLRFFKTNKTMSRTTNAFEHICFLKTTLELDQKPSSICNVIFRSVA